MRTVTLCEGVTLTASEITISRAISEMNRAERERELIAWLATDEAKKCPEYSDIFKDVYGFRPRW